MKTIPIGPDAGFSELGSVEDAVAKEVDAKKSSSPTRSSSKSIHRVRNAPGTSGGRRLMAHELTHVVQQTHGNRYVQRVVAGIQAKLAVG